MTRLLKKCLWAHHYNIIFARTCIGQPRHYKTQDRFLFMSPTHNWTVALLTVAVKSLRDMWSNRTNAQSPWTFVWTHLVLRTHSRWLREKDKDKEKEDERGGGIEVAVDFGFLHQHDSFQLEGQIYRQASKELLSTV
eukprot:m.242895 g.242895  ORF g.242895 m.242895 type:complete len:137 (+) comp17139_c0_seq4:1356-1766(+)